MPLSNTRLVGLHPHPRQPVVRCVVASDHTLFRQGLKSLLSMRPGIQVGEAKDLAAIRLALNVVQPDVLLLDQRLVDAEARRLLAATRRANSNLAVLCLSDGTNGARIRRASNNVVTRVLSKDTDSEMLIETIRIVAKPSAPFPRATATRTERVEGLAGLSAREIQIISLVLKGRLNREIATKCGISIKTVKAHLSRIFWRLGVSGRDGLVDYARRVGLLPDDRARRARPAR